MNQIFLWGFMASGKSFWSERFAKDLGLDLVDLDLEIENLNGLSISEIFTHHGEDHFRQLERDALQKILHRSDIVVSCGGGTPIYSDLARLMNSVGLTIFVDEEWATIQTRLNAPLTQRPLAEFTTDIKSLYLKRRPVYLKAHCIFKPHRKEYYSLLSLIQKSYLLA